MYPDMTEGKEGSGAYEFIEEGRRTLIGWRPSGEVLVRQGSQTVARYSRPPKPRKSFFAAIETPNVVVTLEADALPEAPREVEFLPTGETRGRDDRRVWVCTRLDLVTEGTGLPVRSLIAAFEDADRTAGADALWLCREDSSVAIYSSAGEELVSFHPVWRDSDRAQRVDARCQVWAPVSHPLRTAAILFALALRPVMLGLEIYQPMTIEELRSQASANRA